MKHQQYREWALTEVPLPQDQQRALQQHLQACPECRQWQRALTQIETALGGAAAVSAPSAFAGRFQARLARQRAGRQRRQAWFVLSFSLAGSLVLIGMLAYATISSLPIMLAELLKGVLNFSAQVAVVSDLAWSLLGFLPSPASSLLGASMLIALLGSAVALFAGLGGLWAAAVYRFAYPTNRIGGTK